MGLLDRNRPCDGAPWGALQAWYAREPGRSLAALENALLRAALEGAFGYHLVVVGHCPPGGWLEASPIRHQVVVDLDGTAGTAGVRARAEALPFRSDSVDAVVLAHTLDYVAHPHEALREAERVLVPEGHLVVLGFNPFSLWGLRWVAARRRAVPWCGRRLAAGRVRDWLELLGFDVLSVTRAGYRPPLGHAGLMQRLARLEDAGRRVWPALGAVYVVVARKRVLTLTPVRPRWRPRRALVPAGGLAEPSPRLMAGCRGRRSLAA